MYSAPRSVIHWGFPGLLEVDIRPPAPRALSHTDILTFLEHNCLESNEADTALVIPPPITEK